MAKGTKKKAVTKSEGNLPAEADLFEGGSSGFEGVSSSAFKTPFLKVLQSISPEVENEVKGAKGGRFINTVTKNICDELNIIVLEVREDLVVWQPNRGGFVGSFPKTMEKEVVAVRKGVEKFDKDNNEVVDTISYLCMNADDPTDIFIFPLSGASLKHARAFNTRIRQLKVGGKMTGVTWAGIWNIKTVKEENDKGKWFSIGDTPDMVRIINKDEKSIILEAQEMLKTAETDFSNMANESTDDGESVDC
jgi:hypothetical protein